MILKLARKYLFKNLLLYSLIVLFVDQITKNFVLQNFEIYQSIEITSFLNIVLVFNTGAAFSMFSDGYDWQRYMLITSSITIIFFLMYYLHRYVKNNWLQQLSICLIISGALGNLIDRVRLGMVVDFIDFHIWGIHWPAFNVADSAISIGALTLIVLELKYLNQIKKGSQQN